MSLHIMEDLTSCILDFQANVVRVTYRKKTTFVNPEVEASHAAALACIWANSKLDEETDKQGGRVKWRKLGFETEDVSQEFREVGVLGLDCLVCRIHVAMSTKRLLCRYRKNFQKMIQIFQRYVFFIHGFMAEFIIVP